MLEQGFCTMAGCGGAADITDAQREWLLRRPAYCMALVGSGGGLSFQ